ncbi:MAG: hypothetical protein JWL86_5444 [Rhizobium sp.]|nr:hypothetical protein [Rhizobium sp.]
MKLVDDLKSRVVMTDRGNGNVTDDPDELCQKAAKAIEGLFGALKDMTEWWAYGMAKPPGAKPSANDMKNVEQLADRAITALHAVNPEYVRTMPRPGRQH